MASSISQLPLSESQGRNASQAQRTEEAKAAFTASLKSAGATIDADLQFRAKTIHANAENLQKQDKKVVKETKQLTKDADALDKFLKKTEKGMPDIDGFEDEIAKIEADLDILDHALGDYNEEEPTEPDTHHK